MCATVVRKYEYRRGSMRKALISILTAALILFLAGCGKTAQSTGSGGGGGSSGGGYTPPPIGWDENLIDLDVSTNEAEYYVGQHIIVTVIGIYEDTTTRNISPWVEITGNITSSAGTKTITAKVGDLEKSIDVLVKNAIVLQVNKLPNKSIYRKGVDTIIDLTGIEVLATIDNDQQIMLTKEDLQVISCDFNVIDLNSVVSLKYENLNNSFGFTTFPVKVIYPAVLELTIDSGNDRRFILPIRNGTQNDLTIEWGDENIEICNSVVSNFNGVSHTFPIANTSYVIKIGGNTIFNGTYNETNGGALGFGFTPVGDGYGTGFNTVNNRGKLTAVSGNLIALLGNFNPIDNSYMFSATFYSCSNLNSITGLFSGISTSPTPYMFSNTFYNCHNLAIDIPDDLFSGINGVPAECMFYNTFINCNNLTGSIPATLFSNINGSPAPYMFYRTFLNCSKLTGSIPANLFSGINGSPASGMFEGTFSGCNKLTGSIPASLFSGISGSPAQRMFVFTFSDCSGLTGSIPANLFSGINGAPANSMFGGTFSGCNNLTGIPANLFSGISGSPAPYMFNQTFLGCSGLTGSIPAGLFSNISGSPTPYMFSMTFSNCSNLTGGIPTGLFSGISGAPETYMFQNTFSGCSGLTGGIPADLFSGITGNPAIAMFARTFSGCSNLTGNIPANLFSGISGSVFQPNSNQDSIFGGTFSDCSKLTGIDNPFVGVLSVVGGNSLSNYFLNTFRNTAIPSGTQVRMTNGSTAYTI